MTRNLKAHKPNGTQWDSVESRKRNQESEIDNLGFASGYAEPGYSDPSKGVLFANWNYFPQKALDLLESYGFECEWSDEWSTCEDCGKAVRTSPDSYGWSPSYVLIQECSIVCWECLLGNESSVREWLESLEDNSDHAVNLRRVDLAKYGYRLVEDGFESGMHPGQNDKPSVIADRLHKAGYTGLLFRVDDSGQFDIGFSVWAKHGPDMGSLQVEFAEREYQGI